MKGKDDLEWEFLTGRVWPRHGGSGGIVCVCLSRRQSRPKSNHNFLQSSDRQVKHPPRRPPGTREGDNGLISVRIQPVHPLLSELTAILPQVQRLVTITSITAAARLNLPAGCADVLTKPKLDKHRAMCNSSFDCIDCSKRFESPADYKGHTSCISEAEKYQKSLYNGGVRKHVVLLSTANAKSRKQADPERNNRNQRSRQQGGGRQWGNNRLQWQQRSANKATGANDTPLGTPARMSPVNDTPVADENSQKDEPTVEVQKKRKAEPEATDSKVRFYWLRGLRVPTMDRIPLSQQRRKRNRKMPTAGPVPASPRLRYGLPGFLVMFLKPDCAFNRSQTKLGKKRKSTPEVPITEGRSQDPVEARQFHELAIRC